MKTTNNKQYNAIKLTTIKKNIQKNNKRNNKNNNKTSTT